MCPRPNELDRREQRRNRRARNNAQNNSFYGRHSKIIKVIVFTTSILAALISWGYHYTSTGSDTNKVSKLLLSYTQANKELMETFETLTHLLHHDPLSDIISEQLRPVQDRLASLRAQTGIYERMETKIPGGPTQFMTSTLSELDRIVDDQILPLEEETILLLHDDRTRINEAVASAVGLTKSQRALAKSFMSEQMEILVEQGVDLVPPSYSYEGEVDEDKIYLEENQGNITFEYVNQQLQYLGELYQLRENILEQESHLLEPSSADLSPELRFMYASQGLYVLPRRAEGADETKYAEVKEKLRQLHIEISREIEDNRNVYELSMPFRNELIHKLNPLVELLKESIEQRRLPYLRLKEMILKDIANLRIRVSNLQYKYVKVKAIF